MLLYLGLLAVHMKERKIGLRENAIFTFTCCVNGLQVGTQLDRQQRLEWHVHICLHGDFCIVVPIK